jgi:uncharacterized membrane protein YdjX (TVP38/TMEM64 family)
LTLEPPPPHAGRRWTAPALILLALILVPFALFEESLTRWARELIAAPGPWSGSTLAGLLALDILLPVPSSMVSTASGALLGFWGGLAASTLGMTAGCLLGYGAGRGVRLGAVRRLVGEAEMERVRGIWERHGAWTLVILRAVPVMAEASVVFAGLAGMPVGRFLLITAVSNLCISAAYAAAGAFALGAGSFFLAFAAAVLVPLIATLAAKRSAGSKPRRSPAATP